MCSEIGRKIFRRGLREVGTSDEVGRLRVAVIIGDMRQGQSYRKDSLTDRLVKQNTYFCAYRMTVGRKVYTEEIMQPDKPIKQIDTWVVPSVNTFLPHLLSNVCMFA